MNDYGHATLKRNYLDDTVTVIHADPVIGVSVELLDSAEPWAWDGETLQLDTAGEYRYRPIGPVDAHGVRPFERVES